VRLRKAPNSPSVNEPAIFSAGAGTAARPDSGPRQEAQGWGRGRCGYGIARVLVIDRPPVHPGLMPPVSARRLVLGLPRPPQTLRLPSVTPPYPHRIPTVDNNVIYGGDTVGIRWGYGGYNCRPTRTANAVSEPLCAYWRRSSASSVIVHSPYSTRESPQPNKESAKNAAMPSAPAGNPIPSTLRSAAAEDGHSALRNQ
jgi:hypothetical protein